MTARFHPPQNGETPGATAATEMNSERTLADLRAEANVQAEALSVHPDLERIAEDQRRVTAEAIARGAAENPMREPARSLKRPSRALDNEHVTVLRASTEPESSREKPSTAVIRCLRDVVSTPVSWLWPQRIARGKVTLIAGDPGLGKSQLTAMLAACVSDGRRWPGDESAAPLGNVLILNAEDDAADTICPRLAAADADVSRIHILDAVREFDTDGRPMQRAFNLAWDIETLDDAARRIGDVAMIVIDPISAYLGAIDSHRNADVRGLLARLSALAADIGAAVVVVSHLNKSAGTDALMRVTGSLAFVAAARAAYLIVRDAQERARRLFLPAKNNLGPDQGTGLAFRVVPVTLENGIATSRIEWESEPVAITANEALAATLDDPEMRALPRRTK